jgi:hypothetical protein
VDVELGLRHGHPLQRVAEVVALALLLLEAVDDVQRALAEDEQALRDLQAGAARDVEDVLDAAALVVRVRHVGRVHEPSQQLVGGREGRRRRLLRVLVLLRVLDPALHRAGFLAGYARGHRVRGGQVRGGSRLGRFRGLDRFRGFLRAVAGARRRREQPPLIHLLIFLLQLVHRGRRLVGRSASVVLDVLVPLAAPLAAPALRAHREVHLLDERRDVLHSVALDHAHDGWVGHGRRRLGQLRPDLVGVHRGAPTV